MSAMRANSESLNIGDTFLTKYEIRGLIGRGGQATVFHSYDTFIDRDVAIKIMADAFDSKREHSRRAQMEARVLCKFHHPNIVRVYDAGSTDSGAIYIIMELLKGRTLRDVFRALRTLTVYEALWIGAQIADGVEVAHQQQVIHRDLKPENIFVVDGNAVKVLDFGIAKFLSLTGITTQRDTLQGTMWYISPEHVQGYGVTVRSDIYALGSILYEAICGTPPCLVGLQEITTQSVAWSQISRVPPQLDEIVIGVPPHVGRLIQRMLVKEPNHRPASMEEVAVALRAACKRLEVESGSSATVLRELWNAEQNKSGLKSPLPAHGGNADTSKEQHAPNLIQPTVEVRQMLAQLDVETESAQEAVAVIPAESGITFPNSLPDAEQSAPAILPQADFVQPGAVALNESLVGRAMVTERSGARSAPVQKHSALSASSVLSSRRRQLIVALVLGAIFGIALGFSGRFSAKITSLSSQPITEVSGISLPKESPSAISSSSMSSSMATLPELTAHPASSIAEITPSSVHRNSNPRNPGWKPSISSADKGAAKNVPGTSQKPPYTVDDLE
jgi:serine/threonine protein kinase